MIPMNLHGQRILITGASSGIGRACAICAAELGANVILTGRRTDALEATLDRCVGSGHSIISGDIASSDFISELATRTGKIDGLVHAAGVGPMCPVGMLTDKHIDSVMRTNYYSFLELMKYYSKNKYRNSNLSVVAISSVSSSSGWGGVVVYCGSKGALSSSVRALSMELAHKGVRVNAVCPSNIKTPMYEAGSVDMNDESSLTELLKKQPLGLGEPEQVAWPVCFLLSDAASFITGVNLPVDGGYLAQ